MKKLLGLILTLMCVAVPAFADQEPTSKDMLPLQRLHYCKHADGQIYTQREECGKDALEVIMEVEKKLNPNVTAIPLSDQQVTEIHSSRSEMWMRLLKWLGFALVFGIVAKVLNRSFFLWAFLGLIVRAVLVALHVFAF